MKNFLFDVDGTLTPHRQPMTDEFKHFFMKMLRDKGEDEKVFLVTGSDKQKTIEQVGLAIWHSVDGSYQNCGNQLYIDGQLIKQSEWELSGGLEQSVKHQIRKSVWNGTAERNIEKRIGMANMTTIGRDCTQEQREYYYEWDQQWKEREYIVEKLSANYPDIDFAIGGQISIDIYPKGKDKSQVLEDMDGEVFFFGDACQENGNDYPIYSKLDVFHAFWVKNFEETRQFLEAGYEQT